MTTQTRFTPGPWALWGAADPSQIIASADGFVAQTVGRNDAANAALIAAAPRLYAALERFERFAEGRIAELGELSEEMQSVLDEARVALKQARGEV
jgi:hypothetical protein